MKHKQLMFELSRVKWLIYYMTPDKPPKKLIDPCFLTQEHCKDHFYPVWCSYPLCNPLFSPPPAVTEQQIVPRARRSNILKIYPAWSPSRLSGFLLISSFWWGDIFTESFKLWTRPGRFSNAFNSFKRWNLLWHAHIGLFWTFWIPGDWASSWKHLYNQPSYSFHLLFAPVLEW